MSSSDAIANNALSGPAIHELWESVYRNSRSERLYELAFDWIAAHGGVPIGSRWLDVGCGIGQHSVRLHRRGYRVVASDFSPDRVRAAAENIQRLGLEKEISVRREDVVAGLSFSDQTFDAVLCWGVLMHIPRVELAMKELIRVTKPGGKLFVCEANLFGVDAMISRLAASARAVVGQSRYKRIVATPLGREYWISSDTGEWVVRHTWIPAMQRFFEHHGCCARARICGEFTEWYSRTGLLAAMVHSWNEAWFQHTRSPYLAHGNLLVFEKQT